MKNSGFSVREKLIAKYLEKDDAKNLPKRTDINVLLNRVKTNQKMSPEKTVFFSCSICRLIFIWFSYFLAKFFNFLIFQI